jgi:hypothetical protein
MMEKLLLTDGQQIELRIVELPKATKCVLKLLKPSFSSIQNPKVTLEHALRTFTCLTEGDTIAIDLRVSPSSAASSSSNNNVAMNDNDAIQTIEVVSVEPKHGNLYHPEIASAVCLIDSTLTVEFTSDQNDANSNNSSNNPVSKLTSTSSNDSISSSNHTHRSHCWHRY